MGGTHRFALAAAQTVLDRIGDVAQLAFFENNTFQFHQVKAGGVGTLQIAASQQLAAIEMALGVNLVFVGGKCADLVRFEEIKLGDADAVLTRDYPAQFLGQMHDALNGMVCLLKHVVII